MAAISLAGTLLAVNEPAIIPQPQKTTLGEGGFSLNPDTGIFTDEASRATGEYLAERLRKSTGYEIKIRPASGTNEVKGDILITTAGAKSSLGAEGYELTATTNAIVIRAPAQAGLFYGAQTLLQLLPPEIFAKSSVDGVPWLVPSVQIEDLPRFKWRGYMLDVSRHFFNKEEIKNTLDFMALHKLNVFHWHLVDDHGWRIEIKKYPRLTQIGAWRKNIGFELDTNESSAYGSDGQYGGFYTQDDIREIVAYAQARHITIVPEIEMPGHATSAMVAYPDLSATGGPFTMDLGPGIFDGVYSAGNEAAYKFLEDVLREVFELFPGKYVHIGGDEVPKGAWKNDGSSQALMKREGMKDQDEIQSYFIRRIEKFLNANNKTLVGWSEILHGGLAQNATVMDWKGGGPESANSGHDVVMAVNDFTYFCYYQSLDRPPKLKAARRYLPLEKAYAFNPIPADVKPESLPHILGVEGCIWTFFFASMHEVEEMSFPRLCALAEVAWSPNDSRNFEDFSRRLKTHLARLDHAGVAYWNDHAVQIGSWQPSQIRSPTNILEWEVPPKILTKGKFRLSMNYTQGKNGLGLHWAALLENGREVTRDTHEGLAGKGYDRPMKARDWNYFLELPEVKPDAHYSVRISVSGEGGTDSAGVAFIDPPQDSSKK